MLGKTVKDRERPNGNTTERSAKTVSEPQRPIKPDFHLRSSLDASKIFVIEKQKNKSNPNFFELISNNVGSVGNLPHQVLVEGF